MEPLKSKLDEMVAQKIIVPVDKPTDFVSNLVITQKKDGSLRLCLDPKHLNDQIKREHFQIPTFDDIVSNLGGKKYFTVLDQKDSYWQVELNEDSAPLTTFSTPFGRFMFLRMPFGISCAAEILQKKTYQVFGAIPDTYMIADDMLIASDTEVEHDNTLRTVLNTAIQSNVKFKLSKTQLKQSTVSYYGHELGKDGLRPDPSRYKSGSVWNHKHLSWGVYGFIRHIKIALKRYKDILQIQLKYNKMHTVILHSPHAHLFTMHSFIRSFIHSHHTTHASPMHHPFITHCIILCITHSSHCIPTHHTMHHPFVTLHLNTSYQ